MVNEKRKRSSSPKDRGAKGVKSAKVNPELASEKGSRPLRTHASKQLPLTKVPTKEPGKNAFSGPASLNETNNCVKLLYQYERGFCKASAFKQLAEQCCVQDLRSFQVREDVETPELRVTAIQWHPHNPHLFVTGGKSGGLLLFDVNEKILKELKSFPGVGPGGTMEAIRFNTKCSGLEVCTASVDGTVSSYNFDTELRNILVDSQSPERVWFCSVDVNHDGKSVYAGDNTGHLAIHHLDNGKTNYRDDGLKLHTAKIRHLEFNSKSPNVMVTCSLDKTAKLWDIRKMSDKDSCIECLVHKNAIATSTFSLTDGCRLLTTDLFSQLRVYKAPLWTLEQKIQHPHRHYQHLTVIRGSWHPMADLFLIGRYPDPKNLMGYDDLRSVDVFSASSGRLRHELTDNCRLITSLCQFNCRGTMLCTSSGQ